MRTHSIFSRVMVVVAGVALLAGCGSKDGAGAAAPAPAGASPAADNGVAALEPAAILDRAQAALKRAKSFHVKGTVTTDDVKFTIDLRNNSPDAAGTLGFGEVSVQLLKVGGAQYIKPDEAFWKMSDPKKADGIIEVVGDRWVQVPAGDKDFGSWFTITDVVTLLEADGKVTKGKTKTIAGTPAIGLVDGASKDNVLYVATVGEPYPLAAEGTTSSDVITFGEFGETFSEIKSPAAPDVLDLNKIKS